MSLEAHRESQRPMEGMLLGDPPNFNPVQI
jgi:hypothetical protein